MAKKITKEMISRIEYAEHRLIEAGIDLLKKDNPKEVRFEYEGSIVTFWPLKGWASGKSIQDGRGLNNLIKQLKDG